MPYKNRTDKQQYSKQYNEKWHADNRERRCKQIYERRQQLRDWFTEYKKSLACSRCGFSHPAVIDFHHAGNKEAAVSRLVAMGCCKERILEEIAKCETLCSNCHRILHYEHADVGKRK